MDLHWNCFPKIQKTSKQHDNELSAIIGIEGEVGEVRNRPKRSLGELERMAALSPNDLGLPRSEMY